ncbi:MAG: hypothetical protein AAF658_15870, partial [Myxococcota bacterium]
PSRASAGMTHNPIDGQIYLYGGEVGSSRRQDFWRRSGTSWIQISASNAPGNRSRGALAASSDEELILLVGGRVDTAGPTCLDGSPNPGFCTEGDTWGYGPLGACGGGSCWVLLDSTSIPGRRDPRLAYDESRGVFVLFGGRDENNDFFRDTWEWDGEWTLVSEDGPAARSLHNLVYDPQRERVVLLGGDVENGLGECVTVPSAPICNDVWEWDGTSWLFRLAADPEGDGEIGPFWQTGAASQGDVGGVLVYGVEETVWRWDGGAETRPGAFASFAASEGFAIDEVTLRSVEVEWHGGGSGFRGNASSNGASLNVWDSGQWRTVATNALASLDTFGTTQWCTFQTGETAPATPCTERASLRELFLGERAELHAGATTLAPNGTGVAELRTDYIEAVVRYRLP